MASASRLLRLAALAACGGGGGSRDHVLLQTQQHAARVEQKAHPLGWPGTGEFVAASEWCRGEVPASSFNLTSCGPDAESSGLELELEVKVMTYNLFWWNLYGIRQGDHNSAGNLISHSQQEDEKTLVYDFMAFQECDDVFRVLNDAKAAGLSGEYGAVPGGHALGIIYRSSRWSLLDHGVDDVAEDHASQWYGNRGAQWARLEHSQTGKTVLLVNHHGPLPVNSGGKCGGRATAYNILHTVATKGHQGDAVIVTGDFNAGLTSATIPELSARLNRVFTGLIMGGIDHIFSSSCSASTGRRLSLGGSDHEALDARIRI